MSYYDHATLMHLKLDRWSEGRFLPHGVHQQTWDPARQTPGATRPPIRRTAWLQRVVRYISRQRHVRT